MKKNIILFEIIIALLSTLPTFAETTYLTHDVSNWEVKSFNDCRLDTTKVYDLRQKGASEDEITKAYSEALYKLQECNDNYFDPFDERNDYSEAEGKALLSANKYATELFGKIVVDDNFKNKNVVFSPTCMQIALAMLANGTDDKSAYQEITTALGKQDMPLDELNALFKKRLYRIQHLDSYDKIGISNAILLKKGAYYGTEFLNNTGTCYKALASNVDFCLDSTYTMIDDWAKKSTDGMIPSLGLQPDCNRMLVMVNALMFQSYWTNQFDPKKTKSSKFVTSLKEKKRVKKMNGTINDNYAETEEYQLISVSLNSCKANIILPKEGVSPKSILSKIDLDNIPYKEAPTGYRYHIKLSLPKFSTDTRIPLKDLLMKYGMTNTFSKEMNKIANETKLEEIKQLAHLEIDELGVKVSATIISEVCFGYEPKPIYVDMDVNRPFIITIQDEYEHEVLFIGLINDPTEK